jgi:hypothetical protein
VSLGDSYTARPLIPLQIPPFGCLKSNNNHPRLTARNLGLVLTDPSCSGPETEDMRNPQDVDPDGPNPPQFDSLTKETDIVTPRSAATTSASRASHATRARRRRVIGICGQQPGPSSGRMAVVRDQQVRLRRAAVDPLKHAGDLRSRRLDAL